MTASVCSVTTLCAPLEQVRTWVNYHLNLGVSQLYLYFDNPDDPAFNALADHPCLTCIRCNEEYWPGGCAARATLTVPQRQWFNAMNAWNRARVEEHGWLVHFDCDELIHTSVALPELLSATPQDVDVVRFGTWEAVPDRLQYDNPFQQVNCFKLGPCRPTRRCFPRTVRGLARAAVTTAGYCARLQTARIVAPRAFRNGHYLRGHTAGKAAVRVSDRVGAIGAHVPVPGGSGQLNARFVDGGGVLHFDGCDYQAWRDKWLKRYRENRVPPSRGANRAWQMRLFKEAFESGNENELIELFKLQYFVPDDVRGKLLTLGLLRIVQPENTLFESVDGSPQELRVK